MAPDPPPFRDPDAPPPETVGSSTRKAMAVLAVAFVFPVAVYLGFWLGGKAGGALGWPTLGGILGGVIGAVAGFLELFHVLKRSA